MSDSEPQQTSELTPDIPVADIPVARTPVAGIPVASIPVAQAVQQITAACKRLKAAPMMKAAIATRAKQQIRGGRSACLPHYWGSCPSCCSGSLPSFRRLRKALGTHQQLGLPPCSARVIFGVRCPACGMTTSWAHFTRGQWLASPRVNLGGFLLAFYAVAFAAASLWSAKQGRVPGVRVQQWYTVVLMVIAGVTFVDWGLRLTWGG